MFIVGLTKKICKNSSGKVYHRAKGNFCTVVGVDASFLVLHGSVSVSLVKFGTTKQSPLIDIKSMTKRLKIGYFLKYTINKCQVTSEMTHFIFDILSLRAFI